MSPKMPNSPGSRACCTDCAVDSAAPGAGEAIFGSFGARRRFEAHDEILSRFDLLVVEAGNLLELVERLAHADFVEPGEHRGGFLARQASHALELDVRGAVDVERSRRLAEKMRGEVLEDRAEFLVSALGAPLDHVGDDFFPALARQAHGRRPLCLMAGAADLEERVLSSPIRQLGRGGRAQSKHEPERRNDDCANAHGW